MMEPEKSEKLRKQMKQEKEERMAKGILKQKINASSLIQESLTEMFPSLFLFPSIQIMIPYQNATELRRNEYLSFFKTLLTTISLKEDDIKGNAP